MLDFASVQLDTGRRFGALAICDACTCRRLSTVAGFSRPGKRVARELDRLIVRHDKPIATGSDNETELTCNAIPSWTAESGMTWHYINPGKPIQIAFIKS